MRLPDPVWPVVALALVQIVDALFCVRPVAFVRRCLTNVGFPRRYWRLLTPLKLAAAAGLLLGIVVPYLGLVTSAALVGYFGVAITMHIRRRDFGRDLFLNATGMLLICVAVTWWSFLR
ncbi:DoxX family protein [Plantactinospora sp. WMMB782]|uniref:DoxX family protein n=1 Tax=Plantactinospora sp. WMMB782 TaxID=3404121 RepID=UPI003B951980